MLNRVEDSGAVFYEDSDQVDPVVILKQYGINTVRLRLWHNPIEGYSNLNDVLSSAERAKSESLDLILDFHYSDTWADPANQEKPIAWQGIPFQVLCDSIELYSQHVISKLKQQNTLPRYVQIGNETDCGILWPEGYVCDSSDNEFQWGQLKKLYRHAIKGINQPLFDNDTLKIISHVSHNGSWYFNNLIGDSLDFDVLAISYYPMWHGSLNDLNEDINYLSIQFQKPILIAETAYPFTLNWNDNINNILGLESQLLEGYNASEIGQFLFIQDVITLIKNNNFGLGISYWAPEWISTDTYGSSWENQALFDFDGEILDGAQAFSDHNVSMKLEKTNGSNVINNIPNPFNPFTYIKYEVQERSDINITIYNILGNTIKNLLNENQNSGIKMIKWDSTDNQNNPVSSGVYFYKIILGDKTYTKKMLLLN